MECCWAVESRSGPFWQLGSDLIKQNGSKRLIIKMIRVVSFKEWVIPLKTSSVKVLFLLIPKILFLLLPNLQVLVFWDALTTHKTSVVGPNILNHNQTLRFNAKFVVNLDTRPLFVAIVAGLNLLHLIHKPISSIYNNILKFLQTSFPNQKYTVHSNGSWFMESRATHHMTQDLYTLQHYTPYYGDEQVIIGNGKSHPVLNIGSTILHPSISSSPIQFTFILHTPQLSKGLISIAKLCYDNKAFVEFYHSFFLVNAYTPGWFFFGVALIVACTSSLQPLPNHLLSLRSVLQLLSSLILQTLWFGIIG